MKTQQLNTSMTILHLKQIFLEYGIPKTIVTDGGPQFNTEFQYFTRSWHFQHIKSSPHHLQSNGLAKRFVQTVKTTLIKTMATKEDPHLALLIYRATPLSHNLQSPAELLNLRRYSALLPTRVLAQRENEERNREVMKQLQSMQNNQKTTTQTELQGFKQNEPVYIQLNPHRSKWKRGIVIKPSYENSSGCSYKVQTETGGVYIRN